MKNILKDLDILFYKFFDNGKSLNDLKKNLDIKKFNYLNYPRKNLITEKTEEKLILKNLEFIMNNSQFDFNIKSKLASFLAKGNIKK